MLDCRPNFITLLGFLCIVANTLSLIYFSPNLIQPPPNWLYFTFAIGLFVYQSFDAIDGKQARRTGTSSPLGQLFDHGCDALNTSLGVILAVSALNVGPSWLTMFVFSTSLANFYMTTWEEYHTGTLYLGLINGPTEGVLFLVLVYIWSGIKGPQWWSQELSAVFPSVPTQIASFQMNEIFIYSMSLVVFPVIITCFINVYSVCKKEKKSFAAALPGVLPFFLLIALVYSWLATSPDIFQNHLMVFLLFVGVGLGNMVGKMILAHVVHSPFPYYNVNLILLVLGAGLSALRQFSLISFWSGDYETIFVYACFIISTTYHSHFALSVIDQICSYLDINCLTIKPQISSASSASKSPKSQTKNKKNK